MPLFYVKIPDDSTEWSYRLARAARLVPTAGNIKTAASLIAQSAAGTCTTHTRINRFLLYKYPHSNHVLFARNLDLQEKCPRAEGTHRQYFIM